MYWRYRVIVELFLLCVNQNCCETEKLSVITHRSIIHEPSHSIYSGLSIAVVYNRSSIVILHSCCCQINKNCCGDTENPSSVAHSRALSFDLLSILHCCTVQSIEHHHSVLFFSSCARDSRAHVRSAYVRSTVM